MRFVFLFVFSFSFSVFAGVEKFSLSPNDKLVIRGLHGQVRLFPIEGKQEMELNWKGEAPQVTRKGDEVTVSLGSQFSESKSRLSQFLFENQKEEVVLLIKAPVMPVSFWWKEGQLQIQNWTKKASVFLQKGSLKVTRSQNVSAYVQEGNVDVHGNIENLKVETYKAKVTVSDSKGHVKIKNYSGQTVIKNLDGDVTIEGGYEGRVKVQKGKGKIDFKTNKASVVISGFQGSLRGRSEKGKIYLGGLKKGSSVNLFTKEAPVVLESRLSAHVNLGSQSGYISAPPHLVRKRIYSYKVVKGLLSRGKGGGSFYIRTVSGPIHLK